MVVLVKEGSQHDDATRARSRRLLLLAKLLTSPCLQAGERQCRQLVRAPPKHTPPPPPPPAHMLRMTVLMTLSKHMELLQQCGLPVCVSTSMQMLPPAVTCPVYLCRHMTRESAVPRHPIAASTLPARVTRCRAHARHFGTPQPLERHCCRRTKGTTAEGTGSFVILMGVGTAEAGRPGPRKRGGRCAAVPLGVFHNFVCKAPRTRASISGHSICKNPLRGKNLCSSPIETVVASTTAAAHIIASSIDRLRSNGGTTGSAG